MPPESRSPIHCIEGPLVLFFQDSRIFRGGVADYHLESRCGLAGKSFESAR